MFTNKIENELRKQIKRLAECNDELHYKLRIADRPDIHIENITRKKITYGITIKLRNKGILETEITPELNEYSLIQEPLDLNFKRYPIFSIGNLHVCSDDILTVHAHVEQVKDVSFIKITANNSIKVIQTEED